MFRSIWTILRELTLSLAKVTLLYRVSHELRSLFRESVSYVKIYRYNPKHLCPKLNGYGDNGHRKVWASGVSTYCTPSVTPYSSIVHARQRDSLQCSDLGEVRYKIRVSCGLRKVLGSLMTNTTAVRVFL